MRGAYAQRGAWGVWKRKARKTTENQSTMHTPRPTAEEEPLKILHELLQVMKSHSAKDFKTIKDHLESLQAQWLAHEVETESSLAGWMR